MIKMNKFYQQHTLAGVEKEAQMKKGDEPSTSMSSHSAPSPPIATAGTAAATGVTRKGKRKKVLDSFNVTKTGKNDYFDKLMIHVTCT